MHYVVCLYPCQEAHKVATGDFHGFIFYRTALRLAKFYKYYQNYRNKDPRAMLLSRTANVSWSEAEYGFDCVRKL